MDKWVVLVALVAVTECAEVYVDVISGSNEDCSALQDLQDDSTESSNITDGSISNNTDMRSPCRTINYALGNLECSRSCNNSNPLYDSVLKLSNGVHTLERCIAIRQGRNVTIEAENPGQATIRCTEFGNTLGPDNILSCQTEGLTFRGIVFEGCGPFSSNVFINRSADVLFENCTFQRNIGAPLRVLLVPVIRLIHTDFVHNHNQMPVPIDNENTTIEVVFASITTGGGFTYFSSDINVSITIDRCRFVNNTGNSNENSTRPILLSANGHGGGAVIRIGNIAGGVVNITNSLFEGNEAEVEGGGIYFSLTGTTSSSYVYLFNNTFHQNRALLSHGGAISWNFFDVSFNNTLILEDCNFTNNTASSSGAVSIVYYVASEESFMLPDRARFIHCLFLGNRATVEGTAVGVFALVHVEEFGYPVKFINCTFRENIYEGSKDFHSNALLAFRFPLEFSGFNRFSDNVGGGIILIDTRISVEGELLIERNRAVFGGGIALDDSCLIEVTPGANITFAENIATESGGGLHVVMPAIRHTTNFFNRLCFIQYRSPSGTDTPPSEWEDVSINFIGNQALSSGAAIFASDMKVCRWIRNDNSENVTTIFMDQPQDLTPFRYKDNLLTGNTSQANTDLATGPNKIYVVPMIQSAFVQPGETVSLNILVIDEVGNNREAVWSLGAPNEAAMFNSISAGNETFRYSIPSANSLFEKADIVCNVTGIISLNFSLPKTLSDEISTMLTLKLDGCHPGYVMNQETCKCEFNAADDTDRILRRDSESRYVYLQDGVWGGVVNSSGHRRLVTAFAPGNYLECRREGRLSGCLYQWDNESAQCREGRHGRMCGLCVAEEGYGITLDLQFCTKLSCSFGIIVVTLSFLVLFFNIGLPNELKGVLFYLQVIGLIYRPFISLAPSVDDSIITRGHFPLSILANLFGLGLPIAFCISNDLQAQYAALLGYISPLLILGTVAVYVLSIRFIKRLSNRSALDGITLLSLFFYKYVADTSFTLISCTVTEFGWVFQYNGAVNCFSSGYAIIFFSALAVVILFVGFGPICVTYVCIKRPVKAQQYADILTNGLRSKHRWFGGWDIGRRMIFVFFTFTTVQPSLILLLMIIAATFVLMVHLLIQPYEKRHVNIIESFVLMNLLVVAIIYLNPLNNRVPLWFSTILLLAPYLYGVLYLVWVLFDKCFYKKYHEKYKDKQDSFLTKERSIILGRKKLNLGSLRRISPQISTLPENEGKTVRRREFNTATAKAYRFTELRESLLDSTY